MKSDKVTSLSNYEYRQPVVFLTCEYITYVYITYVYVNVVTGSPLLAVTETAPEKDNIAQGYTS